MKICVPLIHAFFILLWSSSFRDIQDLLSKEDKSPTLSTMPDSHTPTQVSPKGLTLTKSDMGSCMHAC